MKACALFVLLVHVSVHAWPVVVMKGAESVRLPCQVSSLPEDTRVVWSRFDLSPSTVHQHQSKYEPYVQNQQYSSRTSVSADALRTGDLSLTLTEPDVSDGGVYTCIAHNHKREIRRSIVHLHVTVFVHTWPVVVMKGAESVRLPCQVSSLPEDTRVLWSRFDLSPSTVHQHQSKYEPYVQNQQYSSRTSVSADALRTGDLSLTLTEPDVSDGGVYTCIAHNHKREIRRSIVHLHVTDPPSFPTAACAVLAAAAAVALAVYLWYYTIPVSQVKVEEGVWLVKLPCTTKVKLPEHATVEWSRCAPKPMTVHQYWNGRDQLVGQDEFYCDRTKMEREPLKSGDLSLTLRDPCFRDSSTYICTVHNFTHIWLQKVVRLEVQAVVKVVEVREGAKSVTLPFRTCVKLPEDVIVEWCRMDGNLMAAHSKSPSEPGKKHKSFRGSMKENLLRTGDLSLTLNKPTQADSSVYFCTVCGHGEVLLQRIMQLIVKGRGL